MYQPLSNNTASLKKINVELVKATLKGVEYATKASIAQATGLSVATCGNILKELLITGEVVEINHEESSGGRPARRFQYNKEYGFIGCMYISIKDKTRCIHYKVTNLIGEEIEEDFLILDRVTYEAFDKFIEKLTTKYKNILAIGIGVPGVVHNGIVGICDIPELIDVHLGEKLKEKYKIAVTIENDMNLTVYGLYKSQQYKKESSVVVMTFIEDSYPGAGIITDGHILKGNTKFAGEVSFLPFGLSREDQLTYLFKKEQFIKIATKTVVSMIAIINPQLIALTGELCKPTYIPEIYNACLQHIPKEHMPRISHIENIHNEYMQGLISTTLESLTYCSGLTRKQN
ncbi:ROK family protein [Priestia megaterium]|uniref:ROK family protein n=1 Tax=Priestia megaterium TaxID=1404 RepID=UPI00188F2051|nr:ROK family protein [Priestia megaterium]